MTAYTIRIKNKTGKVEYQRTVTSESLPRVIELAHAVIDSIWYDFDVNNTGTLIIRNADNGSVCWTENITPVEE